ncbi:DUF4192 family protein [Streptomyces sp. SAI-170]|uniref:DUF4192 domain-containing protein n=1 Tax=Streptomyces sp. SAI-170 TaxID=3377729 RepID=UPI003C7DC3C4
MPSSDRTPPAYRMPPNGRTVPADPVPSGDRTPPADHTPPNGRTVPKGRVPSGDRTSPTGPTPPLDPTPFIDHAQPTDLARPLTAGDPAGPHQVTLRTPSELADALPYLLGYRPEDSIVMVALHDRDGRSRFGGRARLGIPANEEDWPAAAKQLAHGLVTGGERRGARPEQIVVFLCQEPETGETGRQVKERLSPLAHQLRVECGRLDVPVVEALCISGSRFWSYCCDEEACCPSEGRSMGLPGTSVLAAAATYAGLQVRGTLRELRARLQPWETSAALQQEIALDAAGMALVPRILDEASRTTVTEETLELARRVMGRLAEAPPVSGAFAADMRDDELLGHDEAATLILGLQDRHTRDRAAEWMEGDEAAPALRLWRALARRCVGPYGEHAAAPLTLAGWVAWSTGDELEGREALAMALGADPGYLFARLLHQACNEGLDPESLRRCLRAERADRERGLVARSGQTTDLTPRSTTGTEPSSFDEAQDAELATRGGAARGDARPELEIRPPSARRQSSRPQQQTHPGSQEADGTPTRGAAGESRSTHVPRPRTPGVRSAGTTPDGASRTRRLRPTNPGSPGAGATRPSATSARGRGPASARPDSTRPPRTAAKDAAGRRGSCSAPRPADGKEGKP